MKQLNSCSDLDVGGVLTYMAHESTPISLNSLLVLNYRKNSGLSFLHRIYVRLSKNSLIQSVLGMFIENKSYWLASGFGILRNDNVREVPHYSFPHLYLGSSNRLLMNDLKIMPIRDHKPPRSLACHSALEASGN